jgi:hypothetical protein
MSFSIARVLQTGVRAVPAVRYAVGVAGVVAAVAIIQGFQIVSSVAVLGTLVMFGFMVLMLVFSYLASLTETPDVGAPHPLRPIALVFAWSAVGLTFVAASLLLSCFFFQKPIPLPISSGDNVVTGIPGGTAWIVFGKFEVSNGAPVQIRPGEYRYVTNPTAKIIKSQFHGFRTPHVGDQLWLRSNRPLYIVNFRQSGLEEVRTPPPHKGVLDDTDDMDLWLRKGTRVEVLDVQPGYFPSSNDPGFLWLRVRTWKN